MEIPILDVAEKMRLATEGTEPETIIVAALVLATATSAHAGLTPEELKEALSDVIKDNFDNYTAAATRKNQ